MKIFVCIVHKKWTESIIKKIIYLDGFFVRKSVKIGLRVLPSRRQFDDVIFRGRKAELSDQYKSFIKTIKQIYDIVEAYYAEKKYLQLP